MRMGRVRWPAGLPAGLSTHVAGLLLPLLKEQKTWVLRLRHPVPRRWRWCHRRTRCPAHRKAHTGPACFCTPQTSVRLEKPKPEPWWPETPGGRGRVSAPGLGAQGGVPEGAGQGALPPTAQQRPSPAHLDDRAARPPGDMGTCIIY